MVLSFIPVFEMGQCRVVTFFVVYCLSFLLATEEAEFQNIYIAGIRCFNSEKFIFKNYSCFAKSYSRTYSTLTIIGTTKMPLHNIIVSEFSNSEDLLIN